MSALAAIADIAERRRHVCFVPEADMIASSGLKFARQVDYLSAT
jgi:hypothetical protein